ncbi:MAG: hypothetical protein PUG48_01390 [Clostridia bacterium]|nr:hypothetical protein [Clostridia bacterium]
MSKKSMDQKQKEYFQSIRKKILKRLGNDKQVSPYEFDDDITDKQDRFNESTSIAHMVTRFMNSLVDPESPFQWFDFTEKNKDVFVELGVILIQRSSDNHQIYSQMKKLNTMTDFKIFIKDFNNVSLDEICKKNPQLEILTHDNFRRCMNSVTERVKIYNIANYKDTVQIIKDANTEVFIEIDKAKKALHNAGYNSSVPEYIEYYMDLIDHIVKVSIYLINYRGIVCNSYISQLSFDEFFDKMIDGAKAIKEKLREVLLKNKKFVNSDIKEKITRFAYYLERKAAYKESAETMNLLCDEIDSDPEKFDLDRNYLKYRYSFNRIRSSGKNSKVKKAKVLVTESERVTNYNQKIKSIKALMIFARDNFHNEIIDYNCRNVKALFREIYVIKTQSPVLKRTANTIVRDFESKKLFKKPGESYTNEERKILEQKTRFLDLKCTRGLLSALGMSSYYSKYCELRQIMWDTLLLSYSAIDEDYIYSVIRDIGNLFTDLLLIE